MIKIMKVYMLRDLW